MKRLAYLSTLGTLIFVSLTLLVATSARAEDNDQPDTGVARVSLMRGDVQMMRGDSGDQVAATINMPLVRGDKVFTGEKSQAEIQLDHSNIIRLAPGSEVSIADLTRSVIQIQVARGLVNYTVLKTNEANIEVDTPNMAVRPIEEGSYRIQVNSTAETQLIVRKGDADVTTPEGTTQVQEGRIITVRGEEHPEFQIAKAPGRDDWDKWNKDRDDEVQNAKSYKYANHYYTGAQDLDSHGRWVYMPDSGDYAWTPYVGAGWSPYYDGYWGWQPYWGWTWISYEPWGWAPYHYGRWSYYGSSWYWYPGSHYYGYRPMWGPAWVSFIGFGYGGYNWDFGFGYGYNSIGWCPLGRYDSYHPWWGRHNSYTAVNITNITNITNVTNINRGGRGGDQFGRGGYQSNLQAALTNANVRGGITRVSAEDFGRGNFSRAQRGVDSNTLRGGQLVQGRIPVAPTRETLRPVDNNSRIARTTGTENFFSRRQPPTVDRTFNDQTTSVQNMMRNHNPSEAADSRRGVANGASTTAGSRSAETVGRNATPGFGTNARSNQNSSAADTSAAQGRGNAGGRLEAGQAAPDSAATRRTAGNSSGGAIANPQGRGQAGWQRFGQAGQSQAGVTAGSRTEVEPAQRNARGAQAPAQQPSTAPQQDGNWRRFGTGQARPAPSQPANSGASQTGREAPGQFNRGNATGTERQPQAQGARGNAAAPARVEGGTTPPQREASPEPNSTGGWRRFGARSDNSGGDRPALSIRKAITTERAAPRSFERSLSNSTGRASQGLTSPSVPRNAEGSGRAAPRSFERSGQGSSGSQGAAPSTQRSFEGSGRAAPRSFERGGGGGANQGNTGRPAPSSSPRNFTGGSSNRGSSASSPAYSGRGWSAPSGSSAGRAPSGSFGGGGNRSMSAPSGGSGGSRGGWSAPSGGGGRGASAPSGGGRSAPSGSHGGGSRGRR